MLGTTATKPPAPDVRIVRTVDKAGRKLAYVVGGK